MKINLSFLTSPVFGWIFVWTEIIVFYLFFLVFHRVIERRQVKK